MKAKKGAKLVVSKATSVHCERISQK